MKVVAIVTFLFISLFSSERDDIKIEWSESQKLTWADFQGAQSRGQGYAASSSTGISFAYSVKHYADDFDLDYSVACHFYPEESWYDPNSASAYILKHEQTHFDISELHARILRKLISEASFSKDLKIEIKAIYKEVEKQRGEMQHRFDTETNHSINKEKEFLWEEFVAKKLQGYERWKK
jgi:hypothetical protein